MNNLLWQIIRTSPKFTGWAIASFTWFFLFQVALITIVSIFRFHDLQEDATANWHDYIWFTYREMPAMLPMIIVFALASTILGIIGGIYIRVGSTLGELPTLIRTKPFVFLWDVVVVPASTIIVLIGIITQQWILSYYALALLGVYFSHKTVAILIAWTRAFTTLVAQEAANTPDKRTKDSKQKSPEEMASMRSLKDESGAYMPRTTQS